MQFTVQKENLLNALNAVTKATTNRGIQPILANVLIDTIDSKSLKLIATDLDISIEAIIPATVLEEGKVTLPAKKLHEIASNLPESNVVFSIDLEKLTAKIHSGQAKFDIQGISAEEFPKINRIEEQEELKIDLKDFLKAIKQTIFAAANIESNNILSGVSFILREKDLEIAATDGNRLTRKQLKTDVPSGKMLSVVIPTRILNEVIRVATTSEDESIFIGVLDNQVSFKMSDKYFLSRLIEGKYPDYPKLIPLSSETVILAKRDDLISSIRRTSIMANERTNIIRLDFEKHSLNLSANTPDMGDASDQMEVDYKGTGLKIAFNYKFLVEALQAIETNDVKMEFIGSLGPALFKSDEDDNFLCLIMPVQVK
jgi:DNA polymerase-3 subunit beta